MATDLDLAPRRGGEHEHARPVDRSPAARPRAAGVAAADWREGLPVLQGSRVLLRAPRVSDAPSLFASLATEEVTRFVPPQATSVESFERFIAWADDQRALGDHACFAVVPVGSEVAVGLFQIRKLDATFSTAEWSFAIGSAFWGAGLFEACAALVLTFAFDTIGVRRLEARASARNGRGNGALGKVGAVQEGMLRRSLFCHGQYEDQILWAILRDEWRTGRSRIRTVH